MADEQDELAERTAAGLAYLCVNAEEIREVLRAGGDDAPLEQVMTEAREGGDLAGPLDLLHARLQADGDATGVYGHTRSFRLTGSDSPGTADLVYLCPAGRCSRLWWPQAAVPVPHCEISGQSLRRVRL